MPTLSRERYQNNFFVSDIIFQEFIDTNLHFLRSQSPKIIKTFKDYDVQVFILSTSKIRFAQFSVAVKILQLPDFQVFPFAQFSTGCPSKNIFQEFIDKK